MGSFPPTSNTSFDNATIRFWHLKLENAKLPALSIRRFTLTFFDSTLYKSLAMSCRARSEITSTS